MQVQGVGLIREVTRESGNSPDSRVIRQGGGVAPDKADCVKNAWLPLVNILFDAKPKMQQQGCRWDGIGVGEASLASFAPLDCIVLAFSLQFAVLPVREFSPDFLVALRRIRHAFGSMTSSEPAMSQIPPQLSRSHRAGTKCQKSVGPHHAVVF